MCVSPGARRRICRGAARQELAITEDPVCLAADLDRVLDGFGGVNTLVYSAGFLQRGHIDALTDDDIGAMVNVGILAPMMLVQRLKTRSPGSLKIMLITSSSQVTLREMEPAYCATKSALGMLGASLVRDRGLGKVLVAAPSGIRTPFWKDTDEETGDMLDPNWVAEQIVKLSSGSFKYKFAKIMRNPARVEVVESLNNDLVNN
jgi:NAD(P)-dependent dehydrogenase (short-subunit alcohol dehydrogenase family)